MKQQEDSAGAPGGLSLDLLQKLDQTGSNWSSCWDPGCSRSVLSRMNKANKMSLYEEAGSQEVHRNSAAASSAHMETLMIHFCGVFTETRHKISSTCFVSFEFLVFILDSCVGVFTHSRCFLVGSLMTT